MILVSAAASSVVEDKKFQAALTGGWSHIFQYGTTEQYATGYNDFPVMPAHSAPCLGVAFRFLFAVRLAAEFESLYFFSSPITLIDPSDQDTVEVSAAEHFSAGANIKYYFLREGKIGAYLVAGGGIDKIVTKDREYTSAGGFKVVLNAPFKGADPFAGGGIGLEYDIHSSLGFAVDFRYRIIFGDPDRIKTFYATAGMFIRF